MAQVSAGILMYRRDAGGLEVLLVHPGGPFWAKKDDGAWSLPKGVLEPGESPLRAAQREFREETGCPPQGNFIELGAFKQPGGKTVIVWALQGDFDLAHFRSAPFELEWPPRSGRVQRFPEADRAAWFDLETAAKKILKGQRAVLSALEHRLASERPTSK
jgi:predicted NUDIX family NTP pyrophosphohydrolase